MYFIDEQLIVNVALWLSLSMLVVICRDARYSAQCCTARRQWTFDTGTVVSPGTALSSSEGDAQSTVWRGSAFTGAWETAVQDAGTLMSVCSTHLPHDRPVTVWYLWSSGIPLLAQPYKRTDCTGCGCHLLALAIWNLLSSTVLESPLLIVLNLRLVLPWCSDITWSVLPPPLKLRPDGVLEICMLFVFISATEADFSGWFLGNVNSCSRSLYVITRPSSVCL